VKVVFDTNVYVSALVLPGSRAEAAFERILEGRDQLFFSKAVLDELLGVLARKFSRDPEELARVALWVGELARLVEPVERVTTLADEPDNRILECADAAGAELVVTGDLRLRALRTWRGARIVSLATYLVS
jgi:putative PIN family toxin of toxin-antitoxin system